MIFTINNLKNKIQSKNEQLKKLKISFLSYYPVDNRNNTVFLKRARCPTTSLLEQGYVAIRFKLSLQVLWPSSWTRGSLLCIYLHHDNRFVHCVVAFLSSFRTRVWHLMNCLAGVSIEKQRTLTPSVHLVHASSFY